MRATWAPLPDGFSPAATEADPDEEAATEAAEAAAEADPDVVAEHPAAATATTLRPGEAQEEAEKAQEKAEETAMATARAVLASERHRAVLREVQVNFR